ncbi:MAG: class I SAM-dependent methyltransferase [Anaerolineae bacterium]|nr:class I SAM-dependent methyltransferase [Anaerolineae bacterium]
MSPEPSAFDEGVASHYEAWYETPAGQRADALEKAALRRLLWRFPDAHSVLEVGAGTGHFTRWLCNEGLVAVGLDLSGAMLQHARELDGVTWVQGDAGRLPFAQDAFDLVAFITTLEFLPCARRALFEALRLARQGLLLGVLNRCSPLGVKRRVTGFFQSSVYDAAHFYSVTELKRLVWSLAGEKGQVVWETTLRPAWVPHEAWGGFIAMALVYGDYVDQIQALGTMAGFEDVEA